MTNKKGFTSDCQSYHGILKGEVSLHLFDWFGLVGFANKNKNCQ